jgi:hypothetical protein
MYLELSPDELNFWKALKLLCTEQIAQLSGKRKRVGKVFAACRFIFGRFFRSKTTTRRTTFSLHIVGWRGLFAACRFIFGRFFRSKTTTRRTTFSFHIAGLVCGLSVHLWPFFSFKNIDKMNNLFSS